MTTTQLPWPTGAEYVKLVCRLGVAIQDSTDNLNHPDLMTQGGKVSVKCDAPRIKYREYAWPTKLPGVVATY